MFMNKSAIRELIGLAFNRSFKGTVLPAKSDSDVIFC